MRTSRIADCYQIQKESIIILGILSNILSIKINMIYEVKMMVWYTFLECPFYKSFVDFMSSSVYSISVYSGLKKYLVYSHSSDLTVKV